MDTKAKQARDFDERPTFTVVILYEDSDTGKRAKHFYDRLTRRLEDECDFSLELWNLEMMTIPEMEDSLTRAELVILSLRSKLEFSREFRDWIERWPRLIVDADPALVVLVDTPQAWSAKLDSTLGYLRSVATRHGISFFVNTSFSSRKRIVRSYLKRKLCCKFRRADYGQQYANEK